MHEASGYIQTTIRQSALFCLRSDCYLGLAVGFADGLIAVPFSLVCTSRSWFVQLLHTVEVPLAYVGASAVHSVDIRDEVLSVSALIEVQHHSDTYPWESIRPRYSLPAAGQIRHSSSRTAPRLPRWSLSGRYSSKTEESFRMLCITHRELGVRRRVLRSVKRWTWCSRDQCSV